MWTSSYWTNDYWTVDYWGNIGSDIQAIIDSFVCLAAEFQAVVSMDAERQATEFMGAEVSGCQKL